MKKVINYLENRKALVISLLLLIVIIGSSFAFLRGRIDKGVSANISINSEDTEQFLLNVDKDIALWVNQENLTEGGNNLYAKAIGTATLDYKKPVTRSYNIYIDITKNELIYTSPTKEAEVLLKVTDKDGKEIKNIPGLERVESGGIFGFDITTKQGLIKVKENVLISTTEDVSLVNQNWQFTVYFINLDTNQGKNAGKKLEATIVLQRDYRTTNTVSDLLIASADIDKTLIHHTDAVKNSANDGSYRYTGKFNEVNNFICFGPGSESYNDGLEETCPIDNLYQIIGAFKNEDGFYLAKVIKYDYLTATELGIPSTENAIISSEGYKGNQTEINGFNWDNYENTSWRYSDIYEALNTNDNSFLNYLGNWENGIEVSSWNNEEIYYEDLNNKKEFYDEELSSSYKIKAKIGLAYASEYGYATSQDTWSTPELSTDNWMYNGVDEWLISRSSSSDSVVYFFENSGALNAKGASTFSAAVRPTFMLSTNTVVINDDSKNGSLDKPYRIYIENVKNNYTDIIEKGVNEQTIFLHNINLKNGANDNSFRYSGSEDEVFNYICFGPGSEAYNNGNEHYCSLDNIYRIIGFFKNEDGDYQAKLVKAYNLTDSYAYVPWNSQTNDWEHGELFNVLNSQNEASFWNSLIGRTSTNWQDMVADTIWHVQGAKYESNPDIESESIYTAKNYYDQEQGDKRDLDEAVLHPDVNAKIGLMYINEYLYAAKQEYWLMPGSRQVMSDEIYNNWLVNKDSTYFEWLISRDISDGYTNLAFVINNNTNIWSGTSVWTDSITYESYPVRPTFSLNPDVDIIYDEYSDGSAFMPFKIKL